MSLGNWGRFLLKEVPDLAEDAAAAVARAFENVAPTAATKKAAISAAKAQVKPKAPAVIKARSGTSKANAQDVLAEAGSKGKRESFTDYRRRAAPRELFDKSRLEQVPRVPQAQMPRIQPPRGPSPEMVRTLENPDVQRGVRAAVERGIEGGGLRWYNTEPTLERMRAMMPDDEATGRYARLMDLVAATSPRSKVPDNIRTASYYNYLAEQGLPIADKPAAGYGSIAQNLHRDNARRLDEIGGWDVFKNPKPASFSTNLQGNQRNVTIDTHNMRLPAILSRDPEMLEVNISELADSPRLGLETLLRQYPGLPKRVAKEAVQPKGAKGASVNYKPRDWVKAGYIPMEDAVADPGLWRTKPKPNEYGHYEAWQQQQAADLGISPAQYQASMWLGAGDTTGLGSPPEAFLDTLEARVNYTADRLGVDPEVILEQFLKGDIPLLKHGGRVKKARARGPGC